MEQKLIAQITPTIILLADPRQYVLVIKASPTQAIRNGYHTYHTNIGSCFEKIMTHTTRSNLATGEDKTLKEIASIVKSTTQDIRELFKSFEDLIIS